jgi:putative phage-type endonuclease
MSDFAGRGYIGGGSIAAICGISPFQTKLDAYLSIVEGREETPEQRAFFDNRKAWEPYAFARFKSLTRMHVEYTNSRYDDEEYPWAKAELDMEVSPVGVARDCSVEIKTVHPETAWQWGRPDKGELAPGYVELQAQWGLGVCPWLAGAYIFGLITWDDQRIYEVERDDEAIRQARKMAADFWHWHVLPRRAPQPSNAADVLTLYPRDSGRKVEATADVMDALELYDEQKQSIKLAEARKITAEFSIKDFMRDASEITRHGKTVAVWKADSRGVRRFRLL